VPSALGFGGEAVTRNCAVGEFTKSKARAQAILCHVAFINTRLSLRQEAAGGVHEAKREEGDDHFAYGAYNEGAEALFG
jgi:hypothetical protein